MGRLTRCIHVPVHGAVAVQDLDFSAMQAAVGGYIQAVPVGGDLDVFCNEDGDRLGLPPNPRGELAHVRLPRAGSILGDFLVVRHDGDGELVDVTEDDVAIWASP